MNQKAPHPSASPVSDEIDNGNGPDAGVEVVVKGTRVVVFRDGSIVRESLRGGWLPRTFGYDYNGYRFINIGRPYTCVPVHRIIAEAYMGGFSMGGGLDIDHINGDKADNRPENLRALSRSENQRAFARMQGGSSRFRGVYWMKDAGKWRAQVGIGGRQKYLGCFVSEEAAAIAFDRAAEELGYADEAMNSYHFPELISQQPQQ